MVTNKKRILALCLSLVMVFSITCMEATSSAETMPDPDDEFAVEEEITFKDKQGLTYSTHETKKTIYNPTSVIEVGVEKKDRGKISGKIVIPATIVYPKTGKRYRVTMLENGFYDCKKITSVVLPTTWKTIDDIAFADCHKLSTVKNIQRVREIGWMSFSDCHSLKKLKLDQVVSIDQGAFYGCKKLSAITIGKKCKELGDSAFNRCKKLKTITIKSTKLKKVGKKVFKGTSHKITIKVPKKKLAAYKKLFKNKGNKKVVVKAI